MTTNGRWLFHDPEGTLADYYFAVNPNKEDAPQLPTFQDTAIPTQDGFQGVMTAIQGAQQWTFSGTALSQDQLDMFETWLDNGRNIEVTDHYGYTWLMQMVDISTITRKNAHYSQSRIDWTITALMIGQVV